MTLSLYDEFAGWGGSSHGATAIPGVELAMAANHTKLAIDVHAANFPAAEHFLGDVTEPDIARFPRTDMFWASPACPPWANSRGKRRDFDRSTQGVLFGETIPDPHVARARALMEEIPRYLAHWVHRGRPVLGGVVENVVECRQWDQWSRWLGEIRALGYDTRVIALNSAHVDPYSGPRVPQSRDRLYVAYWRRELGRSRRPDWDKWLRPSAWCPTCQQQVSALQVFKQPGVDMGRYGARSGQYVYRCPQAACRHRTVEPETLGAWAAIDWSADPGPRIGDRDVPLVPATLARIQAGLDRHAGETPSAPFLTTLRGGGSRESAYPLNRPAATFSANGLHHGLVAPPDAHLVVPYYSNGATTHRVGSPLGTLTTKDRYALLGTPAGRVRIEDCTFRMLAADEIRRGMAFPDSYLVLGAGRDQVRGFGNAVTPPAAQVLVAALVETITGETLDRHAPTASVPARSAA